MKIKEGLILYFLFALFVAMTLATPNGQWSSVNNTLSVTSLFSNQGLLLAGGPSSNIYYSTDKGITWNPCTISWTNGPPSNTVNVGDFCFPSSSSVGFAFGLQETVGAFYKTTDGGRTWTGTSYSHGVNGGSFSTNTKGWIITTPWPLNDIKTTTDGGQTWASDTNISNSSNNFMHLIATEKSSSSTIFILGFEGGITPTIWVNNDNSGKNFITATPSTSLYAGGFFSKTFRDPATNYWVVGNFDPVVANAAILKTTDEGQHWQINSSPLIQQDIKNMFFQNRQHFIAVGSAGTIIHTTNEGTTWQAASTPGTNLNEYNYVTGNSSFEMWTAGEILGGGGPFIYYFKPYVIALTFTPSHAAQGRTYSYTASGQYFSNDTSITIEGTGISINTQTVSSTEITGTFTVDPSATISARDVTLRNDISTSVLTDALNIVANPTISKITPTREAAGWSGIISIEGQNFESSAQVTFSDTDVAVLATTRESSTLLKSTISIISLPTLGFKDVTITNPLSQGTVTAVNSFEVIASAYTGTDFLIYPNPLKSYRNLIAQINNTSSQTRNGRIRLYNLEGDVVFESVSLSALPGLNSFTLDLSSCDFSNGGYLVVFGDPQGRYIYKSKLIVFR